MRALVVTGVLGAGCVVVFALAALAATLFPDGTMVNAGWNGSWGKGGMIAPMAVPAMAAPGVDWSTTTTDLVTITSDQAAPQP